MREYGNFETGFEFEPTTEPETVGEYPVSISEDTNGWDSLSDYPFAGDSERNGADLPESSDMSVDIEPEGYSSNINDIPNEIPEDSLAKDIIDEPNDAVLAKIPEDVSGNESDIKSVDDVSGWLGDINPNFDEFDTESPYSNNCGSCAYAVYQRLEGNDEEACASDENIPYNKDMEALTGMEQVSMDPSEIEERLLQEGDGAHAIIGIDRAEGSGHWFNAACMDGKVVAIDGQTGEISDWPPDYGDVVNWEMSVRKDEKK